MIRFQIYRNVIATLILVLFISIAKTDEEVSQRQEKDPFKGFTGYHLYSNSLQMVYYHDLTIAVVEIAKGRELVNCELIEVFLGIGKPWLDKFDDFLRAKLNA